MFASNADKAVVQAASTSLASVPGVTVSPAKCDGTSLVSGSTVLGGDSSAVSSSDKGTVVNDGNGGGNYSNTTSMESIINNGDGTATVNGATVKDAPKVEKVGKLGKFPPVESLKPVESCGTVITLEDGILFDFGKSDIRPDAAQTLKSLAGVLNNAKVPTAHIYGHTDSISDEAFNLQLSQERADAVSAELKKDGVSATLDATGYGESKPVVPNENADGSDNPADRALNSRVEQPAGTKTVVINGSNNHIEGEAVSEITINGSANAVEVKSASKVSVAGSNNAVQYEDGNAPQVDSDSGANNVVSKDN